MTLVMSAGPRNVACKPVSDAGANTTDPMMTVAMEISKRFIFWRLRVEVGFKSKGISPGNREQYEWRSGRSLLSFFMANNLAISDVARLFGLRTSAIRYYERIGILPPPLRKNGQRWYEESVLFRLAVVQRARETGFTLEEIRNLFFGFDPGTRPRKRWRELSQRKLAELEERMKRLKTMERLLKRMENCRCDALEECGKRLLSRTWHT